MKFEITVDDLKVEPYGNKVLLVFEADEDEIIEEIIRVKGSSSVIDAVGHDKFNEAYQERKEDWISNYEDGRRF